MSTSSKPKSDEAAYHHGNLRQALVAEGLVLLEETEAADFSLRELARRVGVSANATYRHFASKEALLAALAAEGFRRFALEQMQAAQGQGDPVAAFLEGGRAYVRFARRHPALFRLMFGRFGAANRNEEMTAAGMLAFEGLRHSVAAALRLPAEDPQVLAAALHAWSLVHGLSHLLLDGQFEAVSPAGDVEALAEAVLRQAVQFSLPS